MKIDNDFTKMLKCELPLIAAPMFIVSTVDLVAETSNAGAIGTIPSLNFRSVEKLDAGLKEIKSKTKNTYGVNLIVHKSNERWRQDLDICVENKVPFFITSLGSPKEVIEKVKSYGGVVFCDVTNIMHAKKVLDHGADGIIAVCAGAGGHAGPHSPFALVSELKQLTKKPIVVAGAIANGHTIMSSLALGASGVSIGTRFIASEEANASMDYKQAILNSKSEDIKKSIKMTGIPASVIKTKEIEKMFNSPGLIEKLIFVIEKKNSGKTKLTKFLRKTFGYNWSWNNVWSAGESVGQINDIKSVKEIISELNKEMSLSLNELNSVVRN